MDWTPIIVALIGGIVTAISAYISIVPQIKKHQINVEDIEEAIENSKSLKSIKAGLVSEMRKSLISEFIEYKNRNFDLTPAEIDAWNGDIKHYKELGGNGVITEFDNILQATLVEKNLVK